MVGVTSAGKVGGSITQARDIGGWAVLENTILTPVFTVIQTAVSTVVPTGTVTVIVNSSNI